MDDIETVHVAVMAAKQQIDRLRQLARARPPEKSGRSQKWAEILTAWFGLLQLKRALRDADLVPFEAVAAPAPGTTGIVHASMHHAVLGALQTIHVWLANALRPLRLLAEREPFDVFLQRVQALSPAQQQLALELVHDHAERLDPHLRYWFSADVLLRKELAQVRKGTEAEPRVRRTSKIHAKSLDQRAVDLMHRWQNDPEKRDNWRLAELADALETHGPSLIGMSRGKRRCPRFFEEWNLLRTARAAERDRRQPVPRARPRRRAPQ